MIKSNQPKLKTVKSKIEFNPMGKDNNWGVVCTKENGEQFVSAYGHGKAYAETVSNCIKNEIRKRGYSICTEAK